MAARETVVKEALNIAVFGLWHLGCVTAASLAQEGFQVCGLDTDMDVIAGLQSGKPPIFEPGLTELIAEAEATGYLSVTTDYKEALGKADVIWVTFDTPVDNEDRANVVYVREQLDAAFPYIKSGAAIVI